jgi:hypothetical protein
MSNYPLLNYNWDFSGNKLPIANSTFAYGQLGQITGSGVQGGLWSSLSVSSLFSNNINLISQTNNSYLTFNVSGIYQITTSLQFTPSSGFNSGTQTFVFSYSTLSNTLASYSYSNNNINGPISFLDGSNNIILGTSALLINGSASGGGSNSLASTNYGGQVALTTNFNSNIPFFILPNYSSSTINNNVNTITSIYYIPVGTTLYFNIGNGSTTTDKYINASGNFTVRLLKYILVPSVVSSNLTVSPLTYTNGYYYYTFVPTTTTSSGTATITFPGNVQMNYLLVGGGGGGGGNQIISTYVNNAGGGGGGGQILNSAISGSTFNLTVGNAGAGGASTVNGINGGNTTLNALTASGGGGGLYTSAGGTNGGGSGATYINQGTTISDYSTSGGSGQIITLSGINLSYSVGGAGGGGGPISITFPYGGQGGQGATGGNSGGNGPSYVGGPGSGYGTGGGGGGGGLGLNSPYSGGQGGPGFTVLYWAA